MFVRVDQKYGLDRIRGQWHPVDDHCEEFHPSAATNLQVNSNSYQSVLFLSSSSSLYSFFRSQFPNLVHHQVLTPLICHLNSTSSRSFQLFYSSPSNRIIINDRRDFFIPFLSWSYPTAAPETEQLSLLIPYLSMERGRKGWKDAISSSSFPSFFVSFVFHSNLAWR